MTTPSQYLAPTRSPSRDGGFSLVLAIAVMAFVFLIMVSFSALVSIEQRMASSQQAKEKARQNALLALSVGLGNLQTGLGPDQRISASADVLSGGDEALPFARRWTGVWNADANHPDHGLGDRLLWLVSGTEDIDHQTSPALDWVTLLGSHASVPVDEKVRLPRQQVGDDNPAWRGHLAWWVGDEGTKVRYNLETLPAASDQNDNGDIMLVAPSHPAVGVIPLLEDYQLSSFDPSHALDYSHLFVMHDALSGLDKGSFDVLRLRDNTSFSSVGLLTNTQSGGLKQDLTTLFQLSETLPSLGPDLPEMELLKSFYNLHSEVTGSGPSASIPPRPQTATEHGVGPVLSMFMFNFGFVPSAYEDPALLRITMRPIMVLVNPHNIHLEAADYAIEWSPEPGKTVMRLGVRLKDNATTLGSFGVNLDEVVGNSARFNIPNTAFAPGEVKVFTMDSMSPQPMPATGLPMLNDGVSGTGYVWFDTTYTMPAGSYDKQGAMNIQRGFNRFTLYVDGQELQSVEDVFNPGSFLNDSANAILSMIGSEVPESVEYGVPARFHHKVTTDDRNNFQSGGNYGGSFNDTRGISWLAVTNPRAPIHRGPEHSDYLWDGNPSYLGVYQAGGLTNQSYFDTATTGERAFWGWSRGSANGQEYVTLFDIPRRPMLSLAQFQHLNVGQGYEPAYAFANSWASPFASYAEADLSYRLNEALWDRFYFSGYDPGAEEMQNRRIRLMDDESFSESNVDSVSFASNLAVEGAFNINSTSVDAWRAHLSSLRGRAIRYFDAATGSNGFQEYTSEEMDNPVARSALPSGGVFMLSAAADATNAEMWNGFRNLTDQQITNLAGQIVHQVKLRGPFLSLADFVNRDLSDSTSGTFSPRQMGALQAAIDNTSAVTVNGQSYPATDINTLLSAFISSPISSNQRITGTGTDGLPNYPATTGLSRNRAAPGYLTQADLLTLMGSTIAPRSDTFTIRAYGDVENELSGESIVAVCEAVVQRIPQPVEASEGNPLEPSSVSSKTLGRQFVLLSFRWLEPDEI